MKVLARLCVVLVATFALMAPPGTAVAAPPVAAVAAQTPAVVVPTGYIARGNYWYTRLVTVGGRMVLTGNIRFSWSHMWYIKNQFAVNASASAILCSTIPTTAGKKACALVAIYYGDAIRRKVDTAISHRKCLTVRFALPPYPYVYGMAWWESTCTR